VTRRSVGPIASGHPLLGPATLGLLAAGLINTAGELIGQPVASGVLGLEFGVVPAALLGLQVLTAAVVIVLAVWELVVRVRNRGRLSTLAA